MHKHIFIFNPAVIFLLTLTACASEARSDRAAAIASGTPGNTVQSVCFTRGINSWQPFEGDSIIIRRGRREYFRLQLAGGCELDRAFTSIGLVSRSGSCLSTGDRVEVPNDFGPACTIRRIETWITPADN